MSRTPLVVTVAIAATGVTLAILAWGVDHWAATPAAVPDHATVFSGTQGMTVAGPRDLGQRFRPGRDRLTAIDLLLAAEGADLRGAVQIELQEWPSRRRLRMGRIAAASVPQGQIWDVRPGQPRETWTSFGFEPLDGGAGQELLFVLSYADGVDRPGERIVTLAHFPGTYPQGGLLVNGDRAAGNLLFRLAAAGTRGEALSAAVANLAGTQPVAPGSLLFPLVMTGGCGVLFVTVLTRLR